MRIDGRLNWISDLGRPTNYGIEHERAIQGETERFNPFFLRQSQSVFG